MGDWNKPIITSLNTNIIDEIKARDVDAATLHEDNTATNIPDKSKRWNNSTKVFQRWLTGAWTNLILGLAGGGTGAPDAAGARTNLDVDSKAEVTTKVNAHANLTTAHGAVSTNTASRMMIRDASGRSRVSNPSNDLDIANKGWVLAQIPSGSIPAGEVILFDKDTAVSGFTLLTDVNDRLVFVTKGSAAGGQTGGSNHSTGTWTQPNHTHTGPSHFHSDLVHTHTGPSHTHGNGTLAIPDHTHELANNGTVNLFQQIGTVVKGIGKLVTGNQSEAGNTMNIANYVTGSPSATAVTGNTAASGTGNTGASEAGNTGVSGGGNTGSGATVNTWRPSSRNMTRQQKN